MSDKIAYDKGLVKAVIFISLDQKLFYSCWFIWNKDLTL